MPAPCISMLLSYECKLFTKLLNAQELVSQGRKISRDRTRFVRFEFV